MFLETTTTLIMMMLNSVREGEISMGVHTHDINLIFYLILLHPATLVKLLELSLPLMMVKFCQIFIYSKNSTESEYTWQSGNIKFFNRMMDSKFKCE